MVIHSTTGKSAEVSKAAVRLAEVQSRIITACNANGRTANSVKLIAVSKMFPINAIRIFAELGQDAFGESYVQQAIPKIAALSAVPTQSIEWHFIGPLQRNKTTEIAAHFGWVHTIDREVIAQRLNAGCFAWNAGKLLNVCLQVNISHEENKHGVSDSFDALLSLALVVKKLPNLRLRGLMGIATHTQDQEIIRAQFSRLQTLQNQLNENGFMLDALSMGMSNDLEVAIACGATHVRIGTALFGDRGHGVSSSP